MPRAPRLHLPGGVYHVILRGNNRQPLFFDDECRCRLDDLVAGGIERYGCRVHAYCWMTNHVHLAVEVGQHPLGRLVQWVASQYARATNRRYGRSGHLFERRHRALLIDRDSYLLQLVRYIHRNPVRAGIVHDPADYRWSSHHAYVGTTASPWLTTSLVLSQFAATGARARARFGAFVREDTAQDEFELLERGCEHDTRISGSERFVDRVLDRPTTLVLPPSLDKLVARVCADYGLAEEVLASPNRARLHAEARARIAWEATHCGAATLAEVARRLNRAEPVLCRAVARYRQRYRLPG